ncbi:MULTISPECIES: ABC transporter substrate-binding protein [Streptomyces]|uniref:Extracellular solute-binding protein n=2 Tax=Streptomyces albus TaxID=1888 RepID=A0A8H1LE12_9ACTN|nr:MULTISPECIES: extracellular solute-binding protein [Streptomyces]TGG83180.1 extracellular solute-binding protein [Streptomyces albus]UVN57091.1 extracellular solute-binding protein [Streptomyces albus]GHJ23850.1 sugar ABC transporter substrate-binding protein [Streptomyces albus]
MHRRRAPRRPGPADDAARTGRTPRTRPRRHRHRPRPRPCPRPLIAVLALLPLLLATACAGGGAGTARAGEGRVRITFWSALRGSQQVVDAYNRSQRRVHVDFEQVPSGQQGGYAKLSNAARAGNAPDVATIEYPQVPGFAIDGVARDLTPLLGERLRARLLPQALALTTFEGRTFSVPLDVEPMVFLYRRDLFAAHHIAVPRTWAQFERAAREVRRAAPGSRIATFPTDGGHHLAGLAWQAGARWFDTAGGTWSVSMTDRPTRKVAAYWQRLIDRGLVFLNPVDTQAGSAQIGRGEVFGKLTAAWDAGGMMAAQPGQHGKWGVAPLPQWDPHRPRLGVMGGSTFAVTKDSAHPRAAMDFIEWQVSSPDSLRARLSSGVSSQYPAVTDLVPVARKAMDTRYFAGQDIYALFRREAGLISRRWTWGPRMTATLRTVQDGLARAGDGDGTVWTALREGERATMPDLEALGLDARRVVR